MKKFVVVFALALASAASAQATEYTVKMKFNADTGKFFYQPARLNIKSGDTVTWVQEDSDNEHNIVAYADGIPEGVNFFESPLMKKRGQKWSMKFTQSGTYRYHCHPHEKNGMRAEIVVDRQSRPEEFRKPKPGEHIHSGGHDDGSGGHKH